MASTAEPASTLRVGEVATLAGVSAQTIRLWESQGLLWSERTRGGQRAFSAAQAERAQRIAALRRRHGWNPAAIRSALTDDAGEAVASAGDDHGGFGARIRAARSAKGLTLEEAAERAGISRSTLSSIELAQRSVTPHLLSSIADALDLTMTAFVPPASSERGRIVRCAQRPITTMAGGVRWEELAPPGRGLEPALLVVPVGGSSGGPYTRPDEIWVCILSGRLSLRVGGDAEVLDTGDSIVLEPDAVWSWHNDGDIETRAIYVERCGQRRPE